MTLSIPSLRRFLWGAGALLAAPAIVRVASLMPVSVLETPMEAVRRLNEAESWADFWRRLGPPPPEHNSFDIAHYVVVRLDKTVAVPTVAIHENFLKDWQAA